MKKYYTLVFCFSLITSFASYAQISAVSFVNANYNYETQPTNIQPNDIKDVYISWRNTFVESCSNGRYRVKFDPSSDTVSEGIAYGMLLSVYANDRELFDGLWLYYQDFSNENGVMNWRISGCSSVIGFNGAADAEFDAAFALIVADKHWGNSGAINYKTSAENLIAIIKEHEIEANTYVVKPGDAWGGSHETNPSYFTTGYFRAFGTYTNDESYWNAVSDKCYAIINDNLTKNNAVYNLVSDWCKADGTYVRGFDGSQYNYDAARTPWRIAMDYVWYGKAEALDYLNLCNGFVNSINGFDNIYPGYNQDGTVRISHYKDPVFTGAYALAGMSSSDQNYINSAYTVLKNQTTAAYFGSTLRAIYMFGLSGNLYNPLTDESLSTENIIKDNQVFIYPNPVNDILNINTTKFINKELSIYDVLGKRVLKKTVDTEKTKLNLRELKSGLYFLKIGTNKIKVIKK